MLLLARGASLELQDGDGDTALHYAMIRTDENKEGSQPLTAAQRKAQEQKRVRLLRLLLDEADRRQAGGAAALANMQRSSGWTCLHLAAQNNLLGAAELLLDRGADLT